MSTPKYTRFRAGCLALLLSAAPFSVSAAIINPIINLDINGTLYDVTIHDSPLLTFNELWDADDDGVFGGGSSVFSSAPTFWLDQAGAEAASAAIVVFLGLSDETSVSTDSFLIPYIAFGGAGITPGNDLLLATSDRFTPVAFDDPSSIQITDKFVGSSRPFVSFTLIAAGTAPAPVTPALLVPGLIALAALKRRKGKRVD